MILDKAIELPVGQEPTLPMEDTAIKRAELRKAAYPAIEVYLDAKVKQQSPDAAIVAVGVTQEQKYLTDCLAVKAKYP